MSASNLLRAEFPQKVKDALFRRARYKVLYGGRGGAKSWGVARALLLMGAQRTLRVVCLREFQKSIADSVHALLKSQIEALGLSGFYVVRETYIEAPNGTLFTFHGLRHNVANIKSLEGADIAWVEEGQTTSKSSWEVLIPTIRKDGSEIWVTFNPVLEQDETYQRFVVKPPPGAVVVKVNWSDNPWVPSVLIDEKDLLQSRDPDAYLNIWEGHCRMTLDGAIYAAELREAVERITHVPYVAGKPVHTAWDLGHADSTSIWFYQVAGLGEVRVIDFVQDSQKKMAYYLAELQKRGYVYGTMFMPHDAESQHLSADKTPAGLARAAGYTVRVLPRTPLSLGIDTARTLFPNAWFDKDKCADGLNALRHYRYDVDPDTQQFSAQPLHDEHSHAADAFRYLALAFKEPKKERKPMKHAPTGNWMAA